MTIEQRSFVTYEYDDANDITVYGVKDNLGYIYGTGLDIDRAENLITILYERQALIEDDDE